MASHHKPLILLDHRSNKASSLDCRRAVCALGPGPKPPSCRAYRTEKTSCYFIGKLMPGTVLCLEAWSAALALFLSRSDSVASHLEGAVFSLLGVAVGSVGRLLGPGEAEAAHPRVRETPAARPRRGDGEANTAVRQPASVTPIQPQELPGSVKVPDLGYHSSSPPACRVGFR